MPHEPKSPRNLKCTLSDSVTGDVWDFATEASSPTGWVVTSAADSGPGTLRQLLLDAGAGVTITFDLGVFPPSSPVTISLSSPLPTLTQGNLTIDASDAGVILDGTGVPAGDNRGLEIASDGNAVLGLQIVNFPKDGILVIDANNNVIGGERSLGSGPLGRGNLISGNAEHGIQICGDSAHNQVLGNYIGTDLAGGAAWPNGADGVALQCSWGPPHDNTVGGTTPGTRNLLSGNDGDGVHLREGAHHNTIAGNLIGTDASGTSALGNDAWGIQVRDGSHDNLIGGDSPDERNIVSANQWEGIQITDSGTVSNTVSGNYIGTDISGTAPLGNGYSGVAIQWATYTTVGGDTAGERNVISGNTNQGVLLQYAGTMSNTIVGNDIGTDASGAVALGNLNEGIRIVDGASHNLIDRNTITGNSTGVYLSGGVSRLVNNTLARNGTSVRLTHEQTASGGGLYAYQATVTISNCVIVSNTATSGGGIYLYQSDATLTANTIMSNTASYGGGLYLNATPATLSGNIIAHNTASNWAAGIHLLSSPATVTANTIRDNTCTGDGAGGLGLQSSDALLEDNTIAGNSAVLSGGAMYVGDSAPQIRGNIIEDNGAHNAVFLWRSQGLLDANTLTGSNSGVFLFDSVTRLTNNVIADNTAEGVVAEGASPLLIHNTLARNGTGLRLSDRWQEGSYYTSTVVVSNTILVENTQGLNVGAANRATLEGTLWHGNGADWVGSGTIDSGTINVWADPQFVNPGVGDYHLDGSSPAIDAGVDAGVTTDLDGETRPMDSGYDIGADETAGTCAPVQNVTLSRLPSGDLYTGVPVRFAAGADGSSPQTFSWTLDGTPLGAGLSSLEHTFDTADSYTVAVAVENACGQAGAQMVVTVYDPDPGQPDLSSSQKTANLLQVESGDTLTYTLVLRNSGEPAASAALTDTLPAYTAYVPGSAHASGGTVSVAGDVVHWSGAVISGTPVLVEFATTVQPAPVGTAIVNTALLDDGAGRVTPLVASSVYNPGYRLTINHGALSTNVPTVTLRYAWDSNDGITHVKISNDGGFVPGEGTTGWLVVDPQGPTYPEWLLATYGDLRMPRTVYARFRDGAGHQYGPVQDDIIYDPVKPQVVDVQILPDDQRTGTSPQQEYVIVRVISSDDNSGVGKVEISDTPGFENPDEYDHEGSVQDIRRIVPATGMAYVRVVDRAGNRSDPKSEPVSIDYSLYMPLVLRNN